jgi:hypothetical protein
LPGCFVSTSTTREDARNQRSRPVESGAQRRRLTPARAGHVVDEGVIHWDGYGSHLKATYSGLCGADLGSGFHTYTHTAGSGRPTCMYVNGALMWQVAYPISRRPQYLNSEVQDGPWAGAIPAGGYHSRAAST